MYVHVAFENLTNGLGLLSTDIHVSCLHKSGAKGLFLILFQIFDWQLIDGLGPLFCQSVRLRGTTGISAPKRRHTTFRQRCVLIDVWLRRNSWQIKEKENTGCVRQTVVRLSGIVASDRVVWNDARDWLHRHHRLRCGHQWPGAPCYGLLRGQGLSAHCQISLPHVNDFADWPFWKECYAKTAIWTISTDIPHCHTWLPVQVLVRLQVSLFALNCGACSTFACSSFVVKFEMR